MQVYICKFVSKILDILNDGFCVDDAHVHAASEDEDFEIFIIKNANPFSDPNVGEPSTQSLMQSPIPTPMAASNWDRARSLTPRVKLSKGIWKTTSAMELGNFRSTSMESLTVAT